MDYFKKYKHKIKKKEELKKIIGNFPRKKKVIICHGVFDIVHPGHVRHLVNAKTKADILVVSITADRFIKKGIYRPHVPENLRAQNLSAFEMIDYVIVSNSKTSHEIIKYLKPDFFAKGFEYKNLENSLATSKENKILKSYGGKILFTPGDIVYSSSKLLNDNLPSLKIEKTSNLIQSNNIDIKVIYETIKNFKNIKVHVIGDTIVDKHTYGELIGGQTKTPTFSLRFLNEESYLGGAGIVAKHLKTTGASVKFTTLLGQDNPQLFVKKILKKSFIKSKILVDVTRPTTVKNSFISGGYRLLKVDNVENMALNEEQIQEISREIRNSKSDIVIFSDFRHGIFNRKSIKVFTDSIPKKTLKVADSQVASRWGNILDFLNFDLITPNEREARFALADQDSNVGKIADDILVSSKAKNVILKLGSKGIFCMSHKLRAKKIRSYFSLDSFANNIIDPVGSGDALLAYSTLAYFQTKSLPIASFIGNIAAACECEIDGNIPVTPSMVIKKLKHIENEIKEIR